MARTIRKTPGIEPLIDVHAEVASLMARLMFSHTGAPAIGNGTTNGRLRTNASVTGNIAAVPVTKASTDDLWNLSAQTATPASTFRAIWLYIDAAGTASIAAGTNAASAAAALAALPAPDETKCIFGVYVAGGSTNFANALAAQGTIHNGIPSGAALDGLGRLLYRTPARSTFVAA